MTESLSGLLSSGPSVSWSVGTLGQKFLPISLSPFVCVCVSWDYFGVRVSSPSCFRADFAIIPQPPAPHRADSPSHRSEQFGTRTPTSSDYISRRDDDGDARWRLSAALVPRLSPTFVPTPGRRTAGSGSIVTSVDGARCVHERNLM